MPDEINDNRLGAFTLDVLRSDQLNENTVRHLANAYANSRLIKRPMFSIKPANDEEEFYESIAPYREENRPQCWGASLFEMDQDRERETNVRRFREMLNHLPDGPVQPNVDEIVMWHNSELNPRRQRELEMLRVAAIDFARHLQEDEEEERGHADSLA